MIPTVHLPPIAPVVLFGSTLSLHAECHPTTPPRISTTPVPKTGKNVYVDNLIYDVKSEAKPHYYEEASSTIMAKANSNYVSWRAQQATLFSCCDEKTKGEGGGWVGDQRDEVCILGSPRNPSTTKSALTER